MAQIPDTTAHKAGFVNIIGKPNVGKSTLMNRLVGAKLSSITPKVQTTRQRIMGIINRDNCQIVYSDTPGIIQPDYALQKSMMRYVSASLDDADIILFLVEPDEPFREELHKRVLEKAEGKILLVMNKIDRLPDPASIQPALEKWRSAWAFTDAVPVSALHGTNIDRLLQVVLIHLPEHPPYFPKDQLSDKSERFFAAEIIREKIFLNYKQEIPYSTEVAVTEFKEEEDIIRIRAEIFVERNSQKGILIGKGGLAMKNVGSEARKDLESFFNKKVFLATYVRVDKDWRSSRSKLNKFGYL